MTRTRAALICALSMTVVLAVCGLARAAEPTSLLGQAPIRWGTPNGFAVTRLGQATFSQNLLTVGQTVSESLTLNSPSGNQTNSWSWLIPAGFTVVSGCGAGNLQAGTGDYSCVLKAVSPTQMQTPACGAGSGGNTVVYLYGGCYNNWTVAQTIDINNVQGTGTTDDYYAILPAGQYAIQGQVLDQSGPPKTAVPVTITASGGGSASAQTNAQGQYGPVTLNQDPAVTVSADGYVASNCPGTMNSDGSCTVNLDRNYPSINFKPAADFSLSGVIYGADGSGLSGTTVAISGPQNATATTESDGDFDVDDLPRGTYTVTVEPKGTAFPVASTDCMAQNLTCTVLLNQDRDVSFTGCVVPNPDGSPLPAGTPSSIPGAVTTGSLEAVGCWAPAADGINYTSNGPVRLDGLDVKPADGTTITLNKNTGIVTSDGPVAVMIGGKVISNTSSLDLNYSGSTVVAAAGGFSSQSVSNFANLFGLPFLFKNGILSSGALPWTITKGTTALTLSVGVPSSLISKWVPSTQQFLSTPGADSSPPGQAPTQTKSVMLNGTMTLTNRDGLLNPNICGTLGSDPPVAPWGLNKPQIKSLQLCYDAAIGQWMGTGQVQLPTSGTVPPLTVSGSLGFIGYNLSQGSFSVSNLNKQIGDGVVLQSIGGSYTPDLAQGIATKITGTAGVSFGPKVSFPKLGAKFTKLQVASGSGTLSLQMSSSPQVYSLSGNVMLLPGTPFAYKIGDASVTYTSGSTSLSPTQVGLLGALNPIAGGLAAQQALATGKLDFTGTLILANASLFTRPLGLGDAALNIAVAGYYNYQQAAVQFTGSTSYTIAHQTVTVSVISNTTTIGLCDQINKYAVGLIYDYFTGKLTPATGECNLTPFTGTQTSTTFRPASAAAARALATARTLHIAAGLKGVTLAVEGSGSAPDVRLAGPGLDLTAAGTGTTVSAKAFVYHIRRTTYIAFYKPAGGTYRLTALKGSAPIHTVLEQLSSAPPKISGRVDGTSCQRVLHYSYTAARGRRVALYAVDAGQRQFLGYAKAPSGVLAFTPTQAAVGAGTVEADTMANGLPAATKKLATFATRAIDPASAPTSVARSGNELYWSVGCGAASYRVTLRHDKTRRVLTVRDTTAKLPANLRGQLKVKIASLDASGTAGGTLSRTIAG